MVIKENLAGHLAFVMDAFYVCPLILKKNLGVHVIVLRVKTFANVTTSS